MKEPSVTVGIMSGETIEFVLNGTYLQGGHPVEGVQTARIEQGRIGWNGGLYDQLLFTPQEAGHSFCLKRVTIGVKFHWERREDQTFRGALKLIVEGDRLTAINELGIEEYLLSVISSEMSATASLELLKSHAVISRSWLLAQIQKTRRWPGRNPSRASAPITSSSAGTTGRTTTASTSAPTTTASATRASPANRPPSWGRPSRPPGARYSPTTARYATPASRSVAAA